MLPFDAHGAQRASLRPEASRLPIRRAFSVALVAVVAVSVLVPTSAPVLATPSTSAPAASSVSSASVSSASTPSASSSVASAPSTSQLADSVLSAASSITLTDVLAGDTAATTSSLPEPTSSPPDPLSEPEPTADPENPPVIPAPEPSTEPSPAPEAPVEPPAEPSRAKVVIVVGPVGGQTGKYIRVARRIAASARTYGAQVIELYSPNATWGRVEEAADGANVLVYIGHGNGWPSGHGPFDPDSKNGMGLNASAGAGNSNTRYYGESFVARSIELADDAVVILNRLCYASGNNEWGRGNPTRATAIKRVDNYGAGFIRAGAAAVFAEGITDTRYILRGLFRTDKTMEQIFWSSPEATGRFDFSFASRRTDGATALMDPYAKGRYYRSVIGDLEATAADWR